ncbi:hypothetical protein L2E82_25486 [Cichorium intybus]|uniref:Uncharacterized protein n=1 Tax=Cichorium intybus TaxID=13427 RepID=A0ACB9E3B7_CICIN|nr:hypothetical protein L2E82_25486 [Cichorium intybus]
MDIGSRSRRVAIGKEIGSRSRRVAIGSRSLVSTASRVCHFDRVAIRVEIGSRSALVTFSGLVDLGLVDLEFTQPEIN